ncbi:MAG: heat-inducible transcription repressor HrcA [Deltaproteobacteria bacterium]|nr:heat-inducible transcription repressor HrcA [Deltaproteobacteria bacterium]
MRDASGREPGSTPPDLTSRQGTVLRAIVATYVGEASPVASQSLARALPLHLSSASIRSTMVELTRLGLIDQPHTSAGRVPTELGLRVFVDELLAGAPCLADDDRAFAGTLGDAEPEGLMRSACALLSARTRQLGFAVPPRVEREPLRHVSLVRLSSEQVLVVLVSQSGVAHQRTIEEPGRGDQAELDRVAGEVNRRIAGRTLDDVREVLVREARQLRSQADRLRARALRLAALALEPAGLTGVDLVIGTRLALLDQPEFRDPERVRALFEALEAKERLVVILDKMLAARGVQVAFGCEIDEPALRQCALVTATYGDGESALGMLGVLGPSRMDFARVIPLVGSLARLVTRRFSA